MTAARPLRTTTPTGGTRSGRATRGRAHGPAELPNPPNSRTVDRPPRPRRPRRASATCMTTGESRAGRVRRRLARAAVARAATSTPSRFARRPWARAAGALRRRERLRDVADLVLADHATLAADPDLAERFTHVFALDPPPSAAAHALLRASGPGFLHLGWGPAEVEFTRAVVEHEHGLRPAPDRGLPGARARLDPAGGPIPRAGAATATGAIPGRLPWPGAACGCWTSSVSRDSRTQAVPLGARSPMGSGPNWSVPRRSGPAPRRAKRDFDS